MLPQISPSPVTSLKEPIGHPNWIYELKHDGFRRILYVDREQAWLVPRKGKKFRQFDPLLNQVLRSLKGQRAILDGEIVVLDEKGRSNFHHLMAHRGAPRYPVSAIRQLLERIRIASFQRLRERRIQSRTIVFSNTARDTIASPPRDFRATGGWSHAKSS